MNEQTTKLIEQLAQKLGTTTEYLWTILLKQAHISASITLVYLVLIIIFGIILYKLHKYFLEKDEHGDTRYENGADLFMIILLTFYLIMFIVCLICIPNIINGFFNPEYWALNEILNTLQ